MHDLVDVPIRQGVVHKDGQSIDADLQQALQPRADDPEGKVKHQRHDPHECRDGRIFSGQELVDPAAAELLLALVRLHDGLIDQLVNEVEPHIRDGGGTIQPALLLHLHDDVFDHFFFVLVELQRLLNAGIALHQLGGCEPHWDPRRFGVILDQVDDAMDAAMHRAAMIFFAAEIHPARPLLIFCYMDGMIHQLIDALIFGGGNGNHRDAQHGFHLVDADGAAVAAHLIHHVQSQHHGGLQFHQLHGQVQVALDVGGVHDIDDASRLFPDDELAGHDLLIGVRGHGVNAGQIGDFGLRVLLDGAALPVHRHAGEIAHMLIGAGELVEQGGLAAVLVARQCKGQGRALRHRVFPFLGVVAPALAETRMLHHFAFPPGMSGGRGTRRRGDCDPGRIVQTQRQLVPMDLQFHRVAHGRKFHQRDPLAGDQPHIQKMLPQGTLPANSIDHGTFADLQFF